MGNPFLEVFLDTGVKVKVKSVQTGRPRQYQCCAAAPQPTEQRLDVTYTSTCSGLVEMPFHRLIYVCFWRENWRMQTQISTYIDPISVASQQSRAYLSNLGPISARCWLYWLYAHMQPTSGQYRSDVGDTGST